MGTPLVLRDVQLPPAPPWWPPAPGWWILAGLLALALGAAVVMRARARRSRQSALHLFDEHLRDASTPTDRLARASELLRRAARAHRADADRLQGDAWLALLDSGDGAFTRGDGRLLLDGPFRPQVDPARADAAIALARARFAALRAGQ